LDSLRPAINQLKKLKQMPMKNQFRAVVAAITGVALCSCANPYADQIRALDARYANGEIGRRAYLNERAYLEQEAARVDRENTRTAIAAAAVGTAIAGTVVAATNHPDGPRGPGPGPRPGGPGPRPGGPPPP